MTKVISTITCSLLTDLKVCTNCFSQLTYLFHFIFFFIVYVDFAKIKENFKKVKGTEDLKKRFKAYTKEKALNAEQMKVAKEVLLPVWARMKCIMALYR